MTTNETDTRHPTPDTRRKRGPKTPEGKLRSRMNALYHGRYARTEQARRIIAERQSEKEGPPLEDIEREMQELFQPKNALDQRLVSRVAFCLWRLARTQEMERRTVNKCKPLDAPTSDMENIVTYERRVELQLLRSLAALGYTKLPKHFLRENDFLPRSD